MGYTVHGVVKSQKLLIDFTFTFNRYLIVLILEKAMAPYSTTLAWKIPWAEEPGGLKSMGSRSVRHD